MIFNSLFKKKNEEENPKALDVETPIKSDVEEFVPADAQVEDIVLADQTQKKSKTTKENYLLRRTPRKMRANRIVHTKKGWNKKPVSAKNLVHVYDYLKKPIITEKTTKASERNIYTFRVDKRATKHDIMNAIEAKYNVVPERVRVTTIAKKKKRVHIPGRNTQIGYTSEGKKAYVYLKKNDKITLT